MESTEDDYSTGEDSTGPEMAHLTQTLRQATVAETLMESSMDTDTVDPGERSRVGTPVAPGIAPGKDSVLVIPIGTQTGHKGVDQVEKTFRHGASTKGQKAGPKGGFTKATGYSRGAARSDSSRLLDTLLVHHGNKTGDRRPDCTGDLSPALGPATGPGPSDRNRRSPLEPEVLTGSGYSTGAPDRIRLFYRRL